MKENFGQSDLEIYYQDATTGLRRVSQFNQGRPVPSSLTFSDATTGLAQKWPGCLVFTSTLLLLENSRVLSLDSTSIPTIRDVNGDTVGHLWMARFTEAVVHAEEDSEMKNGVQHSAALVALAVKERRIITGYLDKSQIYVMLIKRSNGISSRVGVGWVYRYWWDLAEKFSETIVLI